MAIVVEREKKTTRFLKEHWIAVVFAALIVVVLAILVTLQIVISGVKKEIGAVDAAQAVINTGSDITLINEYNDLKKRSASLQAIRAKGISAVKVLQLIRAHTLSEIKWDTIAIDANLSKVNLSGNIPFSQNVYTTIGSQTDDLERTDGVLEVTRTIGGGGTSASKVVFSLVVRLDPTASSIKSTP